MSRRAASWLALSLWVLSVVLVVLSAPLYWSISPSDGIVLRAVDTAFAIVQVVVFSTVGALLMARRPGNRIGWILAIAGLAIAVTDAAGDRLGSVVCLLDLDRGCRTGPDLPAADISRRAAALRPLASGGVALCCCHRDDRVGHGLHARPHGRISKS